MNEEQIKALRVWITSVSSALESVSRQSSFFGGLTEMVEEQVTAANQLLKELDKKQEIKP